jgi:tetratricopeptide (TPR) repeat protein
MLYQDFDLFIDRHGDSLRAQVLNSPAGQASAEFCLPFSEDKLENYLLRLGRTHTVGTRRVESQEMNTAKAFGAALFDAVFTGDVKACFRSSLDEVRRQNAGLRIRLRLGDPSVVDLPWEFLYNRSVNRFIALSVHTPLVRYMDLPERIQPIAVKPPIRVLVMISSPTDFPPLDVEAEWAQLNESLADRIAAGQLAIERLAGASLESLQHRLRRERYHIFHFIGHGEFDQSLQEGVLILESENKRGHKVDSQFLGMLLHDHESLRVAILNACEGARTSRTDPFAGSAQSLVQQGIPAVIAMQFEIANDVAGRFAHEFYGALADGYPIDASLTEARKSIFAAGREVEWGTPVLYLRAPDGRIFDIENSPAPARPAVPSIPRMAESPSRADQDGFAHVVVAAAQAAFAGGQRVEAIEMLRRYDPSLGGIGDALRELTLEHERLSAESLRVTKEKLDEHLRMANELLAGGRVSDAWAHACDALQLDPADRKAIALEARVRKALEAQAARDLAREQEHARRVQEARARENEQASAAPPARPAVANAIASIEIDRAEPVVEQDRRHESASEPIEQPSAVSVIAASGQPRVLWAAAAVLVVAAIALWLVPLALDRPAPPAASSSPAPGQPARTEPSPAVAAPAPPATAPAPAPPAADARTSSETATAQPGPAAAEPATPTAGAAEPAADPPAATTGMVPTPTVPDETAVANFRRHVQTLLVKKDTERAVSVLSEALAYAPADKGLRALAPQVLEQARARAARERSRALARRASGQPTFKQAERAMQRAQALARERKTEASAQVYLDAADLFAGSAASVAASRGDEEVAVAEAAPTEPEAPAAPPPPKFEAPPARPRPTLAVIDPVIDGFASAMSRGDRGALLAVYPNPPAELLAALAKRPRGYNMRIDDRFMISDSRGRPEVRLSVVHESISASGAREEKPDRMVVTLDYVEKTWRIVGHR